MAKKGHTLNEKIFMITFCVLVYYLTGDFLVNDVREQDRTISVAVAEQKKEIHQHQIFYRERNGFGQRVIALESTRQRSIGLRWCFRLTPPNVGPFMRGTKAKPINKRHIDRFSHHVIKHLLQYIKTGGNFRSWTRGLLGYKPMLSWLTA